jgi:integrase
VAKKRERGVRGKPWFRAARDQWYYTSNGKKLPLVDAKGEPIKGKSNRVAAEKAWHEMVVLESVPDTGIDNAVLTILELYLQDMERRQIASKTIKTYKEYFQSFLKTCPGLLIRDLRPFHIHQWWEKSHPKWGNSSKNLSGSALKAAFRWASAPGKSGGIIPKSPLEGMPLPTMRKRSAEVVVTDGEFQGLIAIIKSEEVRDILVVAWDTGTRPVNLCRARAANITEDGNALLFADWNTDEDSAVHKTFKQTGRPLVVPLTDRAKEICLRLSMINPTGPLFRTPKGLTWTDTRLANTVLHFTKRAGLQGRFTAYSCRHTRATALLEAGHSDTDVAAILGNTPGVIHKNYSHVAAKVNRLRDMLNGNTKSMPTAEEPKISSDQS